MIKVILFFVIGSILGYMLRKRVLFVKAIDKVVELYIYFFLFLLGISIGVNDEVMKQMDRLGFNAAVISIAGMIGSAAVSYLVYTFFFKGKVNED